MSHIRWAKSHIGWKNVTYRVGKCHIDGEQVSHIGLANISSRLRKCRIYPEKMLHIGWINVAYRVENVAYRAGKCHI